MIKILKYKKKNNCYKKSDEFDKKKLNVFDKPNIINQTFNNQIERQEKDKKMKKYLKLPKLLKNKI